MRRKECKGVWDQHVHTTVSEMDKNKEPLYSTGNSAQCYMAAWIGWEFGEE